MLLKQTRRAAAAAQIRESRGIAWSRAARQSSTIARSAALDRCARPPARTRARAGAAPLGRSSSRGAIRPPAAASAGDSPPERIRLWNEPATATFDGNAGNTARAADPQAASPAHRWAGMATPHARDRGSSSRQHRASRRAEGTSTTTTAAGSASAASPADFSWNSRRSSAADSDTSSRRPASASTCRCFHDNLLRVVSLVLQADLRLIGAAADAGHDPDDQRAPAAEVRA